MLTREETRLVWLGLYTVFGLLLAAIIASSGGTVVKLGWMTALVAVYTFAAVLLLRYGTNRKENPNIKALRDQGHQGGQFVPKPFVESAFLASKKNLEASSLQGAARKPPQSPGTKGAGEATNEEADERVSKVTKEQWGDEIGDGVLV